MDFVFADSQSEQTPVSDRAIVPPGVHVMTIQHAEEGPNTYKACDENPEGLCLKIRLAMKASGFSFVFDDIPMHLGWRAKQLADAIGATATGGRLTLTPESIEGQTLTVEVSHYTSKVGKLSAVVKKYLPRSANGARQSDQKTPRAAKLTASLATDDIPF